MLARAREWCETLGLAWDGSEALVRGVSRLRLLLRLLLKRAMERLARVLAERRIWRDMRRCEVGRLIWRI